MTQAFNLSQFANKVNTSGQADLTTAVTGQLPVANGGTGTSTPSLVAGTGISISGSFPNQTVTSTVTGGVTSLNGQTGAIVDTTLYAIGSYITGRPANATAYAVNSTIAGSSLYATTAQLIYNTSSPAWKYNYTSGTTADANNYTLINTGTWRAMSPSGSYPAAPAGGAGLWVRIS